MSRLAPDLMTARIAVLPTAEQVAQTAGRILADAITHGIAERGWGSLAVSGGRTPVRTFHELSRLAVDWSRVCITLVDERWVEPSSPESNQRLVWDHLLHGPVRRARFVPMKSSAISSLAGIGRQVRTFRTVPSPLDAVLLGMGVDGHFASLFPRSPALRDGLDLESASSSVAVPPGADARGPSQARMSLTLATIAKARRIVLLTSGAAKLKVLERAIGEICNPMDVPVCALFAARPDTIILHSSQ